MPVLEESQEIVTNIIYNNENEHVAYDTQFEPLSHGEVEETRLSNYYYAQKFPLWVLQQQSTLQNQQHYQNWSKS